MVVSHPHEAEKREQMLMQQTPTKISVQNADYIRQVPVPHAMFLVAPSTASHSEPPLAAGVVT